MATPRMSPQEIHSRRELGERVLFLDTRNPRAWAGSSEMLPGAERMEADQVEDRAAELAKTGALIVTYCT